ncbi:uncharacterized protein LOC132560813, partial [Ylistrum balloti]|uniref:uncharacterized protein LOC132560813 n=1 Tax=Ylistrum balloti TaxID=509963 RepID=UPI002905B2F9
PSWIEGLIFLAREVSRPGGVPAKGTSQGREDAAPLASYPAIVQSILVRFFTGLLAGSEEVLKAKGKKETGGKKLSSNGKSSSWFASFFRAIASWSYLDVVSSDPGSVVWKGLGVPLPELLVGHLLGCLKLLADNLSRRRQSVLVEWWLKPLVFRAVCQAWNKPQRSVYHSSGYSVANLCLSSPRSTGYGETKWLKWREWNVFTGALDEKMHFVFDFQMTLNIRRVDVVLGYGLGCSTSVALVGTDSTVFRSAALLCPAEHTPLKPVKGKLQFQNAVRLTNLWESLQARPFVWLYMILMRGSYGYSGYTTMQVINTARTIAGSRYKTLQTFMLRIQMKDTPCRVVYHSVDDSKIPSNISKMYAELLGITSDDFIVYNEDKKISNQGNANFSKGIRIEAETPVLLETYSKPIAGMVRDLINTLKIPK